MYREVVCVINDEVWAHGIHVGGVYKVTKILRTESSTLCDYMGNYLLLRNDDGYSLWYHHDLFISTRKAKLNKIYEIQGR